MSAPINDGGPAFPVSDFLHPNGQIQWGANGMTLRDYFAAAALQGATAADVNDIHSPRTQAECAYVYADAMLVERERRLV